MAKVIPGRVTHEYTGELVVFHIGARFNKWWRPGLWMPVVSAMKGMLTELSEDPDSGVLGSDLLVNRNGPYIVQYWSSIDKLYEYASDQSLSHRPFWTKFNALARKNPDAVGIWHETFIIERAESMYVGTPPMGLPGATKIRPVEKRHHRARARLADGATALPEDPQQ